MSPAVARILGLHTMRAALIASFDAAVRLAGPNGTPVINAASRAGEILKRVDARTALGMVKGEDWEAVQARTYLRAVILEEEPRRFVCGRSDEGDSR